jgi:hypothetical protein
MKLNARLFWDTDPTKVDYDRHSRHVIERVSTRGTLEEWREIVRYYGVERIKSEALQIRSLDAKTLHFLSAFLNTPISQFRCYTEGQLNPAHSPY